MIGQHSLELFYPYFKNFANFGRFYTKKYWTTREWWSLTVKLAKSQRNDNSSRLDILFNFGGQDPKTPGVLGNSP